MAEKQTYDVVEDGWLLGDHYKAGTTIALYPAQAKYDLPPYGTMLRERAAPKPARSAPGAKSAPEGAK